MNENLSFNNELAEQCFNSFLFKFKFNFKSIEMRRHDFYLFEGMFYDYMQELA